MLREEIEQVKAIAREIAKDEIAQALEKLNATAAPKQVKVEAVPGLIKKSLKY